MKSDDGNTSIITDDSLAACRKAVRAAVVLLPLLGITNVLFMIEAPLDNVRKFALWSYTTHFLRSFQGLFIATLYCFLNGEVRNTVDSDVDETRGKYHSFSVTEFSVPWEK